MNIFQQIMRASTACAIVLACSTSFADVEQTQSNEAEDLPTVDAPTNAEIIA